MVRNYNNSRQLINEMKYLLNTKPQRKKLTLEALIYGEDGEEMMDDEQGMQQGGEMPRGGQMGGQDDRMPMGQGRMQQGGQMGGKMGMEGQMGDGEANPLDEDPEISELITNIRVETLQGLTKLAENPESAQYELLKKIFLLIDKAVEDKVNPEKQQ